MAGMISLQFTSVFFSPWFVSLHFEEKRNKRVEV